MSEPLWGQNPNNGNHGRAARVAPSDDWIRETDGSLTWRAARAAPSDGLREAGGDSISYWQARALAAEGQVRIRDAALATTGQPDEATVVAMENEGVVTWGDDGHRARFLRATVEGT
jgi:hypothetical protein